MYDYKIIGNCLECVILAHTVDDARPRGFRPVHPNVRAEGRHDSTPQPYMLAFVVLFCRG